MSQATTINPHDDLLFAHYQGFYDYLMEGVDWGRTHTTNHDWNNAYDEGRSEAEALELNKTEGGKPVPTPVLDACKNKPSCLHVPDMIVNAATLVNDSDGDNPDYRRALADFICLSSNLGGEHLESVIEAINMASTGNTSIKAHPIAVQPTDAKGLPLMKMIDLAGNLVGGHYVGDHHEDLCNIGSGPDFTREFGASPEYIRALAELICLTVPHVGWVPDSITERIEESAMQHPPL